MADVQLEHGHVRIANSLFDALLRQHLSAREWAVLMAVVRLTYGWGKRAERFGSQQIADMTEIDVRHVRRALNSLRGKRLLMRKQDGRRFPWWQIRKDFDRWAAPTRAKSARAKRARATRAKSARVLGPNRPPSKDRETKEEKNPTHVGGKKGDLVPIRETIREVVGE